MANITIREYFARDGSEFSNKDARVIGPVLTELAKQGGVTRRDVVDAARSPNSPLHPYFEWDDKVAADQHRLYQGSNMLRAIRVRYEDADGEVRMVRAFHAPRPSGRSHHDVQTYKTFQVLHGDSAFAAQMLGSAYDDLIIWRSKYEPYTQMWNNFGDCFQQIVNQINEWAEDYRASAPAEETDTTIAKLLAWREECAGILQTWTTCQESISYVLDAINDAEGVFSKIDERKIRNCIKCRREFDSLHSGHRLCARCLNSKTANNPTLDAAMTWDG